MKDQVIHKQALYELMCRYCTAVDSRNFDHLLSIYHTDAVHDHGPMFSGDPLGLISFLQENAVNMTTHHMIGNHLYHISDDRAQGEIYTVNTHIFHRETGDVEYIAGGRYVDSYKYEQGQWLITQRQRIIDWSREGAFSPSSLQFTVTDSSEKAANFLQHFV